MVKVKWTTEDGRDLEYWEPPYTDEELKIAEKSIYGDVQTVARTHRWAEPPPEKGQPASKRTAKPAL